MCGCDMKSKTNNIAGKANPEEAVQEAFMIAGSAACGYLGTKYAIKQVNDKQKGLAATVAMAAGLGLPALVDDKLRENKYFSSGCNGMAMAGFEEYLKRNATDFASKFGIGSIPEYGQNTYKASNPYLDYRSVTKTISSPSVKVVS